MAMDSSRRSSFGTAIQGTTILFALNRVEELLSIDDLREMLFRDGVTTRTSSKATKNRMRLTRAVTALKKAGAV
jgi:hypothetical protein